MGTGLGQKGSEIRQGMDATKTKNKHEYILISKHRLHITQINVYMWMNISCLYISEHEISTNIFILASKCQGLDI